MGGGGGVFGGGGGGGVPMAGTGRVGRGCLFQAKKCQIK